MASTGDRFALTWQWTSPFIRPIYQRSPRSSGVFQGPYLAGSCSCPSLRGAGRSSLVKGPGSKPGPAINASNMMAIVRQKEVLRRQIEAREKLWPDLNGAMLWHRDKHGWVALPRLMPLMMSIMDDLSGKGFPVGRTYLEMWTRLHDEQFLTLNRPEEMAFHAGFDGQRALRTWKDRVHRLAKLEFIGIKSGPIGELSYAIFFNPYHVVKKYYLEGRIQEKKWQALIIRANEIGAFDIDDIDDSGNLIVTENEKQESETKKKVRSRSNK